MNNVPEWIQNLKKGEHLVLVFPYSTDTVFAEVIENCPASVDGMYFGTLTVNYTLNKSNRQDDLLYDDYSKTPEHQDNWYAYRVT